jgi:predicted aspartyl protease
VSRFFSAAIAVAIAMLATVRAQSPPPDGASLLAKHRAFVGWQFGDGSFSSMRITGSITDEKGERDQSVVMLSRGLIYRNTYTFVRRSNITQHTGFTGNLFWRSNLNGFTTPVFGGDAKYLASFTVLLQEGTTELPSTFIGNKTVDGKQVGVVRVTLRNGDPIDCYVDPATGAYVQATIDPGGSYETTIHILSYHEVVPGKKMIGSYRVGDDKSLHSHDKFEPNAAVNDADLHPPAPTASWTFGSQDSFPITLTHDRILIDATVNGVKGRFILDTGADAIVFDDQFADRVKAPALQGHGQAMMMTGAVSTRVRRVDSIALGGATLHNALVYSQDFRQRDYRGLDRQGYDGLMGFDLFAGAVVKLDVYHSKMTILDPSSDLSGTQGLPLIVDLSDGIPAIPMVLNKSVDINAHLDTGNPGIVFLSYELARKHRLALWARGCGNLESLAIGPITYAGQEACLWGFPSDFALLGFDFLKHFDYVFDYPHGRMFMTPNKN